jgi:hypothetical protein
MTRGVLSVVSAEPLSWIWRWRRGGRFSAVLRKIRNAENAGADSPFEWSGHGQSRHRSLDLGHVKRLGDQPLVDIAEDQVAGSPTCGAFPFECWRHEYKPALHKRDKGPARHLRCRHRELRSELAGMSGLSSATNDQDASAR